MWEIIRAGGGFMWPIILCSIAAVAIILERLWTLQSSRVIPRDLSQKVWNWIEADQLSDKLVVALEQNSPLGKLLAIGLANRNKPRALMVERLEDGGRHVVHELERFLNTLGTIAAVAPLLGLLGTVAGIIHAFNAITANGIGDPRILSGGIGEALITTAAGLTVAIPSLIAYRFLRGKVERLVVRMEKEAMKLVDALDERGCCSRPLSMNLRPRHREDPEINLISLIDVLLVLLIFFMVSTTFNQEGRVKVQLPQSSDMPVPRGSHEPLVITVTAEGGYRVNERTLINASPDTLRAALLKEAGTDRGPITIRADARTTHQAVVTAMDVAGQLGFAQLNIATVHEEAPP